ncbi:MAG: helix-turn-helix domain-containing protein [Oscillospiraceae bacterium]|nr:helix-turn-helix domain-containing protein [Oscillospiraceae bacterium]
MKQAHSYAIAELLILQAVFSSKGASQHPNIEAEWVKTGMTKLAMATEIGVSPGTLKNWQNGKKEIPASKIAALAKLFGATTDYLLGRTNSNAHAVMQTYSSHYPHRR